MFNHLQPHNNFTFHHVVPMSDILTQLQDAVDQVGMPQNLRGSANNICQLANQFVASIYYVHKHHDLQTLSKNDTVRQQQKSEGEDPGDKIGKESCYYRKAWLGADVTQLIHSLRTSSKTDK